MEGRGASGVTVNPFAVMYVVIDALENLGVPYVIGGSMASSFHGSARATRDADLIADLQARHATPLTQALKSHFYVDEAAVLDAIQRRASFNAIHWDTSFKVDVFVPPDREFDRSRFERGVSVAMEGNSGRRVCVSSAEDTVLAKLEWYRLGNEISDSQWKDVSAIIKRQRNSLDMDLLLHWAQELGVADLLERALNEVNEA